MSQPKYPDSLRQQAIALFQNGKGYKAISRLLNVSRDTVRNWVIIYRTTGRTESVRTTGQFNNGSSFQKREVQFAAARREYETTKASLLSIAQARGLCYNNLRNFLRRYHPESELLHAYAKQSARKQAEWDAQLELIQQKGEEILSQFREELNKKMQP